MHRSAVIAVPVIRCRRIVHCALAAICLMAARPAVSEAGVYYYVVSRYASYTQASNASPATPNYWSLSALVFHDVPDEVLSGTFAFFQPNVVTHPLVKIHPNIQQFFSAFYDDPGLFAADYPATTYTLSVERGFGPEYGGVFVDADLFCVEIPHLTVDTFDRLQDYHTALPFHGTINSFSLAAGTNVGGGAITIVEQGQPVVAWSATFAPGDTTFDIPPGQLLPGTSYSISIAYSNSVQTLNAGFGTAMSEAQFQRDTTAYFTTLTDTVLLGDMNCDNAVNAADMPLFVEALLAPGAFSGCDISRGDMNQDTLVDGDDISPFTSAVIAP